MKALALSTASVESPLAHLSVNIPHYYTELATLFSATKPTAVNSPGIVASISCWALCFLGHKSVLYQGRDSGYGGLWGWGLHVTWLHLVLHRQKEWWCASITSMQLQWRIRTHLCNRAAPGMEYLHQMKGKPHFKGADPNPNSYYMTIVGHGLASQILNSNFPKSSSHKHHGRHVLTLWVTWLFSDRCIQLHTHALKDVFIQCVVVKYECFWHWLPDSLFPFCRYSVIFPSLEADSGFHFRFLYLCLFVFLFCNTRCCLHICPPSTSDPDRSNYL